MDIPDAAKLRELAAKPLSGRARVEIRGGKERSFDEEGFDVTGRLGKIWLPAGKRSASSTEARDRRQAFREQQIDLEDAVEAAGGQRGSAAA